MWPFTITPTITSVESVESLVNEDGNCLINLLQEKPLIAVTVNSLFNGYLWDRNEVSVLVCCPSYRESNKGVMRGRDQLKGVRHIKVSAKRESRLLCFVIHNNFSGPTETVLLFLLLQFYLLELISQRAAGQQWLWGHCYVMGCIHWIKNKIFSGTSHELNLNL